VTLSIDISHLTKCRREQACAVQAQAFLFLHPPPSATNGLYCGRAAMKNNYESMFFERLKRSKNIDS
jgi:hypothetical protein